MNFWQRLKLLFLIEPVLARFVALFLFFLSFSLAFLFGGIL